MEGFFGSLLLLLLLIPTCCVMWCTEALRVPGNASSVDIHFLPCPDLYCCEGKPSPHNPWPCDSISPCARNRTGVLCSQCQPGMTEVFGSPACIPDRECSNSHVSWLLPTPPLHSTATPASCHAILWQP